MVCVTPKQEETKRLGLPIWTNSHERIAGDAVCDSHHIKMRKADTLPAFSKLNSTISKLADRSCRRGD